MAEVQAYTYAAWRAGAALAAADGDDEAAAARHTRADDLQARFEQDFWLPDQEAFAMALDRDKRPVDAITSNMGHLLWAGIVADHDKAAAVARWLVSPELFTGWGVRTLATSMARYSPLSYHNGSVWPHDTAICIAGLRRYGFIEEAHRIAGGLFAAAEALDGRLPELFAGLTIDEVPVPVRYPTSCSPQAWASAAPLLVVRALLGLEPDVPAGTDRGRSDTAGGGDDAQPRRPVARGHARHDRDRPGRRRRPGLAARPRVDPSRVSVPRRRIPRHVR